MNDDILVSLPADLVGAVDGTALVIRAGRAEDLVKAYEILGDRVFGMELHGAGHDVSSLASLPVGTPLLWRLPASSAPELYTHTWLVEHFDLGVMIDTDSGILDAVKTVTAAGAPVVMSLEGSIDCGELAMVLDYYLHSKYLQVPIEFFHSMFSSRVRGVDVSLVDIYPENPDRILYIDEKGRIAASLRFAVSGKFFGRLAKGAVIEAETPLYPFLQNPRKALYLTGSSCLWCEGFDLCGGYLRFIDKNYECLPFLNLFKTIKEEACELSRDLTKFEGKGD